MTSKLEFWAFFYKNNYTTLISFRITLPSLPHSMWWFSSQWRLQMTINRSFTFHDVQVSCRSQMTSHSEQNFEHTISNSAETTYPGLHCSWMVLWILWWPNTQHRPARSIKITHKSTEQEADKIKTSYGRGKALQLWNLSNMAHNLNLVNVWKLQVTRHGKSAQGVKLSTCVWEMPMKNSARTLTIVFHGFSCITTASFHITNKLFTDYLTSQCYSELPCQINYK